MQLIKFNKPLSMTSLEIAKLTDKRHDHIMRDIRNMFDALNGHPKFGESSYINKQNKTQPMFILDEAETLCLITKYNDVLRMKIIKQWQSMRDALDTLRYRKNDTQAQIEAMAIIGYMLPEEDKKEKLPYIKANTVVNKITSDIHGFPKMLQKNEMNLPMLETRTQLLGVYVKLFELGFDNNIINDLLRKKNKLLSNTL